MSYTNVLTDTDMKYCYGILTDASWDINVDEDYIQVNYKLLHKGDCFISVLACCSRASTVYIYGECTGAAHRYWLNESDNKSSPPTKYVVPTSAVCMIHLIQTPQITKYSYSTIVHYFLCTFNMFMYCTNVLYCTVLYDLCLCELLTYVYVFPWDETLLPWRLSLWHLR